MPYRPNDPPKSLPGASPFTGQRPCSPPPPPTAQQAEQIAHTRKLDAEAKLLEDKLAEFRRAAVELAKDVQSALCAIHCGEESMRFQNSELDALSLEVLKLEKTL